MHPTKSQRLFVGNLPPGTTENDLRQEFSAYGNVQTVELKIKENLVDPSNPNHFAFITIEINQDAINQCLSEFKQEQYRGRYLVVSVARESFLDRLKREREEAAAKTKPNIVLPQESVENQAKLKISIPLKKTEKKDSSSEEESSSSDDDSSEDSDDNKKQIKPELKRKRDDENNKEIEENEDPTIFIAKKRASTSLQNGKIIIQSVNSEPIHVITKYGKDSKELDDKGKISDEKRKKSLNKMNNQYNQQKLTIQQALSKVDTKKSNKVIFDNDEYAEEIPVKKNILDKKKVNLFDSDEEDDDQIMDYGRSFDIKEQFEGRNGENLMKLQSKFKLDSRFKMDSKFLENDDNEDTNENDINLKTMTDNDERKLQLNIVEKVIGRKLETLSEPQRKKIRKTMQRYDPTKDEHQKFIRHVENIVKVDNKNNNDDNGDGVEVSKDQFYKVSGDLTTSLKKRGDGFSLLSMFGKVDENDRNENDKYIEKSLLMNKQDPITSSNPFKYDSSDSEDDIEKNLNKNDVKTIKSGGKTTKSGLWTENFFIFGKDQRFIDGISFFRSNNKNDENEVEDYEKVKGKLRLLIKQKISKRKKNIQMTNTKFKFKKRK